MKRTFTIQYGSYETRLLAEDNDDWKAEVLDQLSFINENEDSFEILRVGSEELNPKVSEITNPNQAHSGSEDGNQQTGPGYSTHGGPLEPLAKELRVAESELDEVLYVDTEGDDNPLLLIEDTDLLSSKKTDRQRNASLILLLVWEKLYGQERTLSSDLKEALNLSGVSESNMGNMYQGAGDRYFSRTGRGASASVALTPPGRRAAQKKLKELLNKISRQEN